MSSCIASALPRIGILGNPSDGYGGRVLACTFSDFNARVHLRDLDGSVSAGVSVRGGDGSEFTASSWAGLLGGGLRDRASSGRPRPRAGPRAGAELLAAALRSFELEVESIEPDDPRRRIALSFETDIPRQVGLSGSSAIVTAALRVLGTHFELELSPDTMARAALRAEVELLGIAAGPQDRVVQAHGGLVDMDFASMPKGWKTRPLDPLLLPACYLAWNPSSGESSGVTHNDLRSRFQAGEAKVVDTLAEFRVVAGAGIQALEEGDPEAFRRAVDRNFDLRASILTIGDVDLELVALGRRSGAAVKLCGSGGAVFGVPRDASQLESIETDYRSRGFEFLRPRIAPHDSPHIAPQITPPAP